MYNSVAFEKSVLDNLLESNENDVVQHCVNKDDPVLFTHTHHITVEQVKYAIHKLKPGKSDCIDGIVSDNFKNGTDLLFTLISLLFSAMLIHGIAPSGLLLSMLVPIPKNKRGNCCNSDNYRQIAISSILGKLFDIIVLEEQEDSLCTDILQFGFKKQSSTVLCTSMLLETIDYYNENNQGWGQVQYLYLSTYLSVLDVLEYLVYGNVKVLVLVLDQKVLGTYK